MDGGEQRDGVNMTRALEALAPYLENPRQTVIRIEGFVAAAAALLFLQLILAPWRRWSGNWFVQGALWFAYTISFPLIAYTFGQMATSPVKNAFYPVWAFILFWAAGCANAFMAYTIEDNKQWKRYFFELIQYYVYISVIFRLLSARYQNWKTQTNMEQPIVYPLGFLAAMVFFTNLYRIIAGWMVTNSIPSKLVAQYMRDQVDARAAQSFNPITMSGYRYLVRPSFGGFSGGPGNILKDDSVTINTVWEKTSDDSKHSEQKDVCLSFALSHLLRCHYFELDCAEVGLPETFRFALEGLMPEKDEVNHYSRAFHIIEVELGFLYDFLFTKYATIFEDESHFLILEVLKLILTSICGAFLLVYSPILKTLDPIIEVGTRRVDVTVTVVIMGAIFLFEALQVILYLKSDWATVSVTCSYARSTCTLSSSIIRLFRRFKFDKLLGNIMSSGYWKNKLGQSSIIEGSLDVDLSYVMPVGLPGITSVIAKALFFVFFHISRLISSMMSSAKEFVPIPYLVKDEIVSCLRRYSNGGPLTNGKAAIDRNGILGEFSCTLENHSQTTVMLIWHIATEYCRIASSDEAEVHQSGEEQVATTLSKYCGYLMAFVPELLPGNSTDTLFVVHRVLSKIKSVLGNSKRTRHLLFWVIQDSESSTNEDNIILGSGESNNNPTTNNNAPLILEDSIFIKGLKLGRELEQKDAALRWKLLAEFWAETIIYIAPSDKATVHMERLAQGGEFLTHIWALLKHAGITKRDQRWTPVDLV